MNRNTVHILLATYNGEAYIRSMIHSLLNQDYSDFHIILSDDHSSDNTLRILEEYATNYPNQITHYRSGQRFGCAQKHFMHLLNTFHDAPYIMFCDQDDIWHADKISKTLAEMHKIETDQATPCMVHTDLRVVDTDLNELAPSFCHHSAINGKRLSFHHLLVQNVVTGCTMMINRALAKLVCLQYDDNAMLMHDWWIAILASARGKTAFLDCATIDYRQHGNNSVGAKNIHSLSYLCKRLTSKSMRQVLRDAAKQAEAFRRCYRDLLTADQLEVLDAFSRTQSASLFTRNRIYSQYDLKKDGLFRVIIQYLGL